MPNAWKHAIVRVDPAPETIQATVVDRLQHGWLLDSQMQSPEADTVDLTFRRADAEPAVLPAR